MKTITLAWIDGESLSESVLDDLYNLSPMKNEDGGFSFVVPLSYLVGFQQDMNTDIEAGHGRHPNYDAIADLIEAMKKDNKKGAFVCLDPEFKV